jgi:hypothetical protein
VWCTFAAVFLVSSAIAATHPFPISKKSFRGIADMTHVRHFYISNLAGNLKGTLRAAESTTGAAYPVGSVLQLVPTEVMVKQKKGFNAATHDWEFL